ncbi:S8 family peptidase [Catellatospora tritici]|uniref:S8 family peptidase n=1 Tax=Catellatospora tritici TaxID=2851566 RepID=UPI001C2D6747|nr:S8 family serine peptidase [Catellatospora tritici]MBV1850647.1 S8 family serine peptidase [Catellatospora tritici]
MDDMRAAERPRLTWRLYGRSWDEVAIPADGEPVTQDWAWGGATGSKVRVCVVDSGVETDHPLVGRIEGAYGVVSRDGELVVAETDAGDACGHGTACAGIIRRVAPDCEIYSVRVLGERATGTGAMMLAGLRWAIDQKFDVINLSLSTTRLRFTDELRALADEAYFGRTVIVASAHNTPVESYPWRFSSVVSVGSHHDESQPEAFLYNPDPPVEFFALGQNVLLPWLNGGTIRASGNSFATPYMAGVCARILSKHPRMTTFQLKNALYLSAANVNVGIGGSS